MNSRQRIKRVKRAIDHVLATLDASPRPHVPEIPLQIREYWRSHNAKPVIVVTEAVTNREQPATTEASTPDGIKFYVREWPVINAPAWVLEAILMHELAHAFLSAIRHPLLSQPLTQQVRDAVETEVALHMDVWGFTDLQRRAFDWLQRNSPRNRS